MSVFKNKVGRPSNNVKRARVIISVIAVILSVAIGYALFSQAVTVKGTATASGTFRITPTCYVEQLEELTDSYEDVLSMEDDIIGGTTDNNCTIIDNSHVTFSTNLLYPGAVNIFTIKFTNTGTITAMMSYDTVIDFEYCIIQNGVESCSDDYGEFGYGNTTDSVFKKSLNLLGFEDANENIYMLDITESDEGWEKVSSIWVEKDGVGGVKLEPNESIYVGIYNSWNKSYGFNGENSLNLKMKETYEFPFKQYNK